MQQDVQTGATCNIEQCWELLANNAKMASIVKKVYTANLYMYILGVNSSNGGITNPKCGDGYSVPGGQGASFFCRPSLYGRYVTIRRHDDRTVSFNFCEVEVYSARRGTEPSAISVSSSFFFLILKRQRNYWRIFVYIFASLTYGYHCLMNLMK